MHPVSGLVYEAGNYMAGNPPSYASANAGTSAYNPSGPPPAYSTGGAPSGNQQQTSPSDSIDIAINQAPSYIDARSLKNMGTQSMSLSDPASPITKADWTEVKTLTHGMSQKSAQGQVEGMEKTAFVAISSLPPDVQAFYLRYLQNASRSNAVPNIKLLNATIDKKLIADQKQGQLISAGPFTLWYIDLFTMIDTKGGQAMLAKQTGMSQLGSQPGESPLGASALILNSPQSQSAQLQASTQSQAMQAQSMQAQPNSNRQNQY